MYHPRTPNYTKKDPVMRWNLPDRVFFACGACHILAWAFIDRFPALEPKAIWIRPDGGEAANHIFVSVGARAFDYHGFMTTASLLGHFRKLALRKFPDWNSSLVELPPEVLVSERLSRNWPGLWLRQPGQFLHDALPRARAFLDRMGLVSGMDTHVTDTFPHQQEFKEDRADEPTGSLSRIRWCAAGPARERAGRPDQG